MVIAGFHYIGVSLYQGLVIPGFHYIGVSLYQGFIISEFRYTGVKLYRGFVISRFHCLVQPLFCRCNSRVVAIYDFNNKAVVYSKYSLHFFQDN